MRRTSAAVLLVTAAAAGVVLAASFAPRAAAAGGVCDASLSTLTTNHPTVPAGGNFAATLTATCLDGSGSPVAGRTLVLQPSGGNSTIAPTSVVTDANGVAVFSVSDMDVPPPGMGYSITYTAVDQAAQVAFGQTVTIGFYYCSCGGPPVPMAGIGGVTVGVGIGVGLVAWQMHRRRALRRGVPA